MSDRACNYCMYKADQRNCPKDQKMMRRSNASWGMGGTNTYRVPKNLEIPQPIVEDSEFHKKYFVAWYMELSPVCCC